MKTKNVTILNDFQSIRPKGEIVDAETGEVLNPPGTKIFKAKPNGRCEFNYLRYAVLNTQAVKVLTQSKLRPTDLGLLFLLTCRIEPEFNICMSSRDRAHTASSVAKLLNETTQSARRKLKSLIERGILHHGKINHYRARPLGKVYVLNPHLLRIGRQKPCVLAAIFNPIEFEDSWGTTVSESIVESDI
jgi:hypothetical protein